ncbi:4847_t:CDS:2 [Gigaspora margarita]|uniref:4847_t:CDS:1 n=1 Tax=Gigaspora margarita TaxID=4874 RepID=A0ABN7UXN2_GIGMA|nr:4847_t:CDS:2 [Gigaspora margarita]
MENPIKNIELVRKASNCCQNRKGVETELTKGIFNANNCNHYRIGIDKKQKSQDKLYKQRKNTLLNNMQNSNANITTESSETSYTSSKCVIMLADENKTNEYTKIEIETKVRPEIQEETN